MAVGNLELITSQTGTTVASFDLTNIFSGKYDVYKIQLFDEEVASADYNSFRVIRSAGTDSGSNYDYANLAMYSFTSFAELKGTSSTSANYLGYLYPASYDDGIGVTMYVFNPYDSSSYTFFTAQTSSFANVVGLYGFKSIMVHKVAEQLTGISIQRTGNFDKITANVYGVK
jgi:hypothetical protein